MCCGCVPSGDARYVARVVGSGKDDLQGVDVQGEEEVEECILVCDGCKIIPQTQLTKSL